MRSSIAEGALELAAQLRRGELSSVELVERTLARIRERDAGIHAWVAIDEAGAMRQARRADRLRARGVDLPFLGVPVGIKDHEPVRGHFTRMGSRAFRWMYAPFDGYVARACRHAGFVIVGKCATSELTILPIIDHPPTRSPVAPGCYAGGSSGGSAAAIASGTIPFAPGSDGGGSIRIPASFCGLVGVKPGRGVLPNPYGSIDASGISTIGPLARDVRDAAALLDVLDGSTTPDRYLAACDRAPPTRLRVRLLLASPLVRVDPDVAAAAIAVAHRLEAMGNLLVPSPPLLGSLDEFLPIMARMVARVPMLPHMVAKLEPSTQWLRTWGRTLDADAVAAGATALTARILDWWGDCDVLVSPTVGVLPPRVGAYAGLDGEATVRAVAVLGAFTAPFNLSGQPAISLPLATTRTGTPIGVQLVGRPRAERLLLALAQRLL